LTLVVLLAQFGLRNCPAAEGKTPPSQADLEKKFAETLSGSTFTGYFTTAGKIDESPKKDRYSIGKVSKLKGDYWKFEGIKYGKQTIGIPLTLEVKWAGDTPVITLSDLTIPGIGTFTARVLIYDKQYVGAWSAGDHGGQMFGEISRTSEDKGNGSAEPDDPRSK